MRSVRRRRSESSTLSRITSGRLSVICWPSVSTRSPNGIGVPAAGTPLANELRRETRLHA
jgi:hypothetical protein